MTEPNAASPAPVPEIAGWFTVDADAPALLGRRCTACSTYLFPPPLGDYFACPNPGCTSTEGEVVELSRRGRVWSYTDAGYKPPPPYVGKEPFVPFAIAAVELDREKMVIMGQLADGVGTAQLSVGQEVELVVETLYEDGDGVPRLTWRWRPVEDNSQEAGA